MTHLQVGLSTQRQQSYLEDLLDAIDGGGEQRVDLLVVVDIVGMADAHEEDVRWQAGDRARHSVGRHIWQTKIGRVDKDIYKVRE